MSVFLLLCITLFATACAQKEEPPAVVALAQIAIGNSLRDEASHAAGDMAASLYAHAAQAYQRALDNTSRENFPWQWAGIQKTLGETLVDQAKYSTNTAALPVLERANQAYRRALEVFVKPSAEWSSTEREFGTALALEAASEKSLALYDRAVQTFQQAIAAYIEAGITENAARTQTEFASLLEEQGQRASGSKAVALFSRSVEQYRLALLALTKEDFPRDWAIAQDNLGNALDHEGRLTPGEQGAALYEQSVQAYQAVLEVRTKADSPEAWSSTQIGLAHTLQHLAARSPRDKGIALYEQAIQAYKAALEVRTRADLPLEWAPIEADLGSVLAAEAVRTSGEKSSTLSDQAVQAYRSALEVETKTESPVAWAGIQRDLGFVLVEQGQKLTDDSKSSALFDQAVAAYQGALEVFTRADLPRDWARTQSDLGMALADEGVAAPKDRRDAYFEQARQAKRNAMEVFTRVDYPVDWARTQSSLGAILQTQAQETPGKDAAALYEQAAEAYEAALGLNNTDRSSLDMLSTIYHEQLFRFDRAFELDKQRVQLNPSPSVRLDLMEASLTAAHFDQCIQQTGMIDDSIGAPLVLVRDTIKLACESAIGDRKSAFAEAQALSQKAGAGPQKAAWNFKGTLYFLSTSPAFKDHRKSWIALFTAVQNGDIPGMAAPLQQLESLFQH